jgi:hypothetical protein
MPEKEITKKSVGADLIIPVCSAAYAIYYVWSVFDFPKEAQLSGLILAGMLLLVVGIYFVRIIRGLVSGRYHLGFGSFFGPPASLRGRAIFFVLTLVALVVISWLGFTLTTFAFLSLSFIALGVRPISHALVVAAIGALVGWFFFIVLLGTHFPEGPFERAMEALF